MAECGASGGGSSGDSLDKSITLPPDEIFRNLENAKRFAIDIGGSLTKLAYYSTVQHKVAKVRSFDHSGKDAEQDHEPPYEISVQEEITARLHFVKFENTYIEACLDFIKDHLVNTETKVIQATGGGAYKFKDLIEEKLRLKVDKEDVMTCLIKGCNFVLKNIPQEAFMYQKDSDPEFRFQTNHPNIFPYLLVNIGSGVSIVKVETEDRFEWVGGSSIGGGTFWGLGALLTKTKKFDELLHLASKGQHANVDMLVQDIYGGAHQTLGLSGNLIASSFGKSATADREFSKEDMAKSLLHMISNDIGQLACLYARLHCLDRVYFGGFFIRGHPVTMRTITYSINFFSKGEVQALFLRHEGYLGAIGAFLKGAEQDNPNQYSWGENYAGSSGLMSTSPELCPTQRTRSGTFDLLEMDRLERPLVNLPLLLDPSSYVPDTVDLTDDALARKYWLTCFEEALDGVVKRAVASQPESADAAERAEKFRQKYWSKLQTLRHQPFAYGTLTVRSLLDTREHCLNEFSFPDPYSKVSPTRAWELRQHPACRPQQTCQEALRTPTELGDSRADPAARRAVVRCEGRGSRCMGLGEPSLLRSTCPWSLPSGRGGSGPCPCPLPHPLAGLSSPSSRGCRTGFLVPVLLPCVWGHAVACQQSLDPLARRCVSSPTRPAPPSQGFQAKCSWASGLRGHVHGPDMCQPALAGQCPGFLSGPPCSAALLSWRGASGRGACPCSAWVSHLSTGEAERKWHRAEVLPGRGARPGLAGLGGEAAGPGEGPAGRERLRLGGQGCV
ncbi:4'-phosphopantetheine phosphatase isoform X1 [Ictidomys tridecemlineatus]